MRFYEDTERTVRDWLPPLFSLPPLYLSLSLSSPPGTLIYARRYLCQWIYIPIFIIRNIIARAFIALVEMPSPRRLRPSGLFPLLSFYTFLFLPDRSLRGLSRSMRSPGPYISSHLLKRIFIKLQNIERSKRTKLIMLDLSCKSFFFISKLNVQI